MKKCAPNGFLSIEHIEPRILMSAVPNEWGVYLRTEGNDVIELADGVSWVDGTLQGLGTDILDGGDGLDTYNNWNHSLGELSISRVE